MISSIALPSLLAKICGDDLGISGDLLRQPRRDGLPVVDDLDALADVHDQGHVVLDQQNGHAEAVPDGMDAGEKLRRLRGVHAGGGLVQKEHLHIRGQGPGNLQLPLPAIGQAGGQNVRAVLQAADGQELHGLLRHRPLGAPEPGRAENGVQQVVAGVPSAGGLDILNHRHVVEQADVLKGPRYAGLHELIGLFPVQGHPVQQDGALRGNIHAGEEVEHSGFSRAVGPDQAY